jgi:predicted RNA binding protein YcfA (HicA-like mRNA interferase family)
MGRARRLRQRRDVKVRDVLWRLKRDGWQVIRQRGSHRQLAHPSKAGVVTVAGSASDDLHPKTAASILKQAGLWREGSR